MKARRSSAPTTRPAQQAGFSRYTAALRAAWSARRAMAPPPREADEVAFLPAALSLQDTPVHPLPRRLAYTLMALFVIVLVWACAAQVDIVAIAPGRIMVDARTKVIQPLERSVVRRIWVTEGQAVRAGQSLIELDPTAARADKAAVEEQGQAAQSELLRARALLTRLQPAEGAERVAGRTPRPPVLPTVAGAWDEAQRQAAQAQLLAEWSDIQAKLAKLQAEMEHRQAEIETLSEMVAKLETMLPLVRRREEDFRRLSDEGYVAGHASQDRTRERIEIERDLATQRARRSEALAALRESRNSRQAFVAETVRSLRERESQAQLRLSQALQEGTKASYREGLTLLKAPVDGVVQQLAVHTTGGVVTEAQVLMVVVPQNTDVKAEVVLENKDIGFVRAGQTAEIKLETFPYTRYGTVGATVVQVAADAVNDEKKGAIFPATLALARTHLNIDGKTVVLSPGMNVTAEIKTGHRRVIDYLLSPVQQAANESLRER